MAYGPSGVSSTTPVISPSSNTMRCSLSWPRARRRRRARRLARPTTRAGRVPRVRRASRSPPVEDHLDGLAKSDERILVHCPTEDARVQSPVRRAEALRVPCSDRGADERLHRSVVARPCTCHSVVGTLGPSLAAWPAGREPSTVRRGTARSRRRCRQCGSQPRAVSATMTSSPASTAAMAGWQGHRFLLLYTPGRLVSHICVNYLEIVRWIVRQDVGRETVAE